MSAIDLFLVEDSPVTAKIVKAVAKNEGWNIEHALEAENVVSQAMDNPPKCFLLDVNLPGMSGFELCAALRIHDVFQKTPIIFLTTKGDIYSRLEGFYVGGTDYVPKPFSPDELRERVRAQLSTVEHLTELNSKVEKVREQQESSRILADMVVHDLKNPLSAMRAVFQFLGDLEGYSEEDRKKFLRVGISNAEIALRMVNDILDLGEGRLRPSPEIFKFCEMTTRLKDLFDASSKQNEVGIAINCELNEEITSDPALVYRILSNMLSNAIKFSPANSTITILVEKKDDSFEISVIDEGNGVPDNEKPMVFDLNYQGKMGIRRSGAGVGLAFCRLAAHKLGGEVSVGDSAKGGAVFTLKIPAAFDFPSD